MGLITKKGWLVLLALVSVASAIPIPIDGQENAWDVGGFTTTLINGTLTVSGTGATSAPGEWGGGVRLDDYKKTITAVIFGDGVDSILDIGTSDLVRGALVSVTFSNNIKVIKDEAFFECDNIDTITILNPTPPEVQGDPFPDVNKSTITLYVPKGSLDAYKDNSYWGQFKNIKEVGAGAGIYTVTFNANGGSVTPALSSTGLDGKLTSLPTPTKLGYTFNHWYKGAVDTAVGVSTVFTENTTVYAHWDLKTYKLTYDPRGGTLSGENPATFTFETQTFTLINPTKADSAFAGWVNTNKGDTIPSKFVTVPQGSWGDRNYVAKWMSNSPIIIEKQPKDTTLIVGKINSKDSLRITVGQSSLPISFRWYKNSTNSNIGGDSLSNQGSFVNNQSQGGYSGASSSALKLPTGLQAGTLYYFCRLRATVDGNTVELRSAVATVTVIKEKPTGIVFPDSATITYGQSLAEAVFHGGAGAGAFAYTDGEIQPVVSGSGRSYFVTFTPTNSNYDTLMREVKIIVEKADPNVVWPTSASINIGQTLADAVFDGGSGTGAFAYTDREKRPEVSDNGTAYEVAFTPNDTANYNTLKNDVAVTVIKKNPLSLILPTASPITYGDSLSSSTLLGGTEVDIGTWAWKDSAFVPNAGDSVLCDVVFTPADTVNYDWSGVNTNLQVSVKVNKAVPVYTVPEGITAKYGQTLLEVTPPLPTGWSWVTGTDFVGLVGERTHKATFTPNDTANFKIVANIDVVVTVGKGTLNPAAPVGLTATYGDTLKNVKFSDDDLGVWSWMSETELVGRAGQQTHLAKFTPVDTGNYEIVTGIDVEITVGKANPTYTAPTGLTATYGQTLADVALTGGWSWEYATALVGNVGTQQHTAKFTPGDSLNYNVVTNIEVTVTVDKASGLVATAPGTIMISTADTDSHEFDLSGIALNEVDHGALSYNVDKFDDDANVLQSQPEIAYSILSYTGAGKESGTATLTVKITSDNYKDITVDITFEATPKTTVVISGLTAQNSTYDGETKRGVTGTATSGAYTGDLEYTYTGTGITGTTEDQPINAGAYTLTVSVPSDNDAYTGSAVYTFTIAKATVAKPTVATASHVYDGAVKSAGIAANAAYTVTGDTAATNAGSYTAVVALKDKDNYRWTDSTSADLSLRWSIGKASYDMAGITFAGDTVNYDGEAHSIFINGTLPTGVMVAYTGNGQTAAGNYQVTATFAVADTANYNVPASKTATLTIKQTYTVTVNGGTSNKATAAAGDMVTIVAAAPAAGKVFDKWTPVVGVTIVNDTMTTTVFEMPAGNVTVTASYKPITYTVTWNTNGGSPAPTNTSVNHGDTIKLPASMTKSGNNFGGWYVDSLLTTAASLPIINVTGPQTFYAKWTPAIVTYTITFNPNGGNVSPTSGETGTDGKLASLPQPARSGYVFEGWYTASASTGGTLVQAASNVFAANDTIYARWTLIYTVTFNANGGTVSPASGATGAGGKLASLPTPTRTGGYTFSGWYTDTVSTPGVKVDTSRVYAANAIIYARWTPPPTTTYTITFNAAGGSVSPTSRVTGANGKLATLPAPTRSGGYVFSGWYTDTVTTPGVKVDTSYVYAANTTVYARWAYTITFNVNSNSGQVSPGSAVTGADGRLTLASLPVPTRNNYAFAGWYTTNAAAGGELITLSKVFTGPATVYARWTAAYTITFNAGDGGSVSPQTAATGADSTLASLPTPTKSGYTFIGWYTNATGGTAVTEGYKFSGAATLYARWTSAYTITLNANGGTAISPATVTTGTDGKLAALPAAPTRSGYAFTGWYTAAADGVAVTTGYVFTANVAIYARWAPVYTITFNSNGGAAVSPASAVTGVDGRLAELPAAPARSGYAFDGWYTDTASTPGTLVTTNTVFNANAVIYARWSSNYTITFNANGGTAVSPATAVTGAGGKLATLPATTRSNYAFAGWYTTNAAAGGDRVTTDYVFSGSITVYARWTPAYTITFNANGGTVTPANGVTDADGKLASLPEPVRSGYSFDGWYTTNAAAGGTRVTTATVFAAASTIYARWTLLTYTVTFDANGGAVSTTSAVTGTGGRLASLPAPAARTGYTFAGWYTAETGGTQVTTSTVFNADAAVYARWTLVSYAITYTLNGGTVNPANPTSYTVESADITLNNPTRAAYVFDGWTGANGTAKQTEVTIQQGSVGAKSYTANWTAVSYTISFDVNGGAELTADSAKTAAGGRLSSLPAPKREGYAFDGWFTEASGGVLVTTATVFDGDATVYARWSRICTVTFDANGGVVTPASANTGAGGKLASLPTPTLRGYTCAGWFTAKEGGGQVTTSTVFDGDATIYARWSQVAYAAVTFNAGANGTITAAVDGVKIASGDSVRIGKNVVFTAVPADGYGVARWTINGAVLVDDSRAYTLEWLSEPTTVAVSFEWASVSVASPGREVPGGAANWETSVAPVKALSGVVTVGPNPVRAGGEAAIYWNGGKAVGGRLGVFDALGKRVAVVEVGGAKRIGAWKTGGAAEGAYLIKGVLTDKDGVKVKVSALVGVVGQQ